MGDGLSPERKKDLAIARSFWYQRRYIPESQIRRLFSNCADVDQRFPEELGFLEEYVQGNTKRWAHRVVNYLSRDQELSKGQRQSAFHLAYSQSRDAIVRVKENYNPQRPFMWQYRRELAVSYQDTVCECSNHLELDSSSLQIIWAAKILGKDSDDSLVNLLEAVQDGKPGAFEGLREHYQGTIKLWVRKNLYKHPHIKPDEVESIALTGLFRAAQSCVIANSFSKYAWKFMTGELSRFAKKEAPIPGARFAAGNDRTGLEERIGDIHAAREADRALGTDLEEMTRQSNERIGYIRILDEDLAGRMRDLPEPRNEADKAFFNEGMRVIKEKLGNLRLNTRVALYYAIEGFAGKPYFEDDMTKEDWLKEKLLAWDMRFESTLDSILKLEKNEQAALLLYGLAKRGRGDMQRPMRYNEMKQVAHYLGIRLPKRDKLWKRWVHDPWLGRKVKVASSGKLEDKCTTILGNLHPSTCSNHSLEPSEDIDRIDQHYEGFHDFLRKKGYLMTSRCIFEVNKLDWADELHLPLVSRQANKTQKVLVIPCLRKEDVFREGLSALETLSGKHDSGFQRVLDSGTFGDGIPYAVVKKTSGTPLWEMHEPKNAFFFSRENLWEMITRYTSPISHGVVPPKPTEETIVVPESFTPEITIPGIVGWQSLDGEDPARVAQDYQDRLVDVLCRFDRMHQKMLHDFAELDQQEPDDFY